MSAFKSSFAQSFPIRVYGGIALLMLAAFGLTLALYFLDARVLPNQESVWAKPLKFELALALHAGTLMLVVAHTVRSVRDGLWMRYLALVFLLVCFVEMGYILFQAARAQPSHFNDATLFDQTMFSVMAFCAVFIIGVAGAVGLTVWRDQGFRAPAAVRLGVVLAFACGTVLTLITAFSIGKNGGPYVGGIPELAERMPLTGWSLIGGDLRVAHFVATHMIQVIPLAAIVASATTPPWAAKFLVLGISGFWVALTLLEFLTTLVGGVSYLCKAFALLNH